MVDLGNFDAEKFCDLDYAVILCATHGEGDPPDSSVNFVKWLKASKIENDKLERLRFAVFGLGDSSYKYFNSMGKLID